MDLDKRRLSRQEIAFVRDAYDDCIADLDEQLGRLLDELERRGILERTWLIITSDHGESFGEQPGVFGHGTSLYQPQLHVPLVIVPPRSPSALAAGRPRDREPPRPAGDDRRLAGPEGRAHRSPANRWRRSGTVAPREAVVEPTAPGPALSEVVPIDPVNPESAQLLERRRAWASLAEGDWIYIRREGIDQEELFDLRADPRSVTIWPRTRPHAQ